VDATGGAVGERGQGRNVTVLVGHEKQLDAAALFHALFSKIGVVVTLGRKDLLFFVRSF